MKYSLNVRFDDAFWPWLGLCFSRIWFRGQFQSPISRV